MKRFAVIGAGNGGQCISAYLKLCGKEVRLYERFSEVLRPIQERGGITLAGASLQGFAKLDGITDVMAEAVEGAEIIFVVLPAFAHAYIAGELAGCLVDGQTVILCPGSTGGALEFRQVLKERGCQAKIRLAETNSLFYAARSDKEVATIIAVKDELSLAALPSQDTEGIIEDLKDVYPQLIPEVHVLATGLNNMNITVHPLPVLLNTGRIESGQRYKHYFEGMTPSIGKAMEALDEERMAVGRALGLSLISIREAYRRYYHSEAAEICDLVRMVDGHKPIMAPASLDSRLITEDIPMGMVPVAELGRALGVPTPLMDATIALASVMLGQDFRREGRNLTRLGLHGLTGEELLKQL